MAPHRVPAGGALLASLLARSPPRIVNQRNLSPPPPSGQLGVARTSARAIDKRVPEAGGRGEDINLMKSMRRACQMSCDERARAARRRPGSLRARLGARNVRAAAVVFYYFRPALGREGPEAGAPEQLGCVVAAADAAAATAGESHLISYPLAASCGQLGVLSFVWAASAPAQLNISAPGLAHTHTHTRRGKKFI